MLSTHNIIYTVKVVSIRLTAHVKNTHTNGNDCTHINETSNAC